MNRSSPDIPLLPLEPPLSTQDSISSKHSSFHRTSLENGDSEDPIPNASPKGALLPPSSAEKNAASLKATDPSLTDIFQTLDRWVRRRLPEGWRFGATIGAISSFCVLIGNIIVFVIVSAWADSNNGWATAFVTIREGHCKGIEHIQLGIHVIVNVVSTLLLGASNYCMQCLSAPTRAEVDKEHRRGRFLDIGVPSLRNLRVIKKERLFCWCLLGLSSLPLHLIYNSTFFVSLTNSSYDIYIASHDFQDGKWFDDYLPEISIPTRPSDIQEQIQRLGLQKNGSVFERLDNADCIAAYAKAPLPDRRTLVLVSSTLPRDNYDLVKEPTIRNNPGNCSTSDGLPIYDDRNHPVSCLANSSLYSFMSYRGRLLPDSPTARMNLFYWICSQEDQYWDRAGKSIPPLCSEGHWETIKSSASEWTVYGFKIDYCISERFEHGCKLKMAGPLLIVIIVFNAIKAITITFVVWKTRDEQLITIGDATASFIREPDPETQEMCLYARESFDHWYLRVNSLSSAKSFEPETKRCAVAASKRRWISIVILIFVGLSVILGLLGYGIIDLKSKRGFEGFRSLWELGLGTVNKFTLITGWGLPTSGDGAVILAVLVANVPQTLFSMLYLLINGLFTSLSLASESSRYAIRSTSLRVSNKRGNQRSTYFLQVPYRLAIPLMSISAFLHWIMSQAIFFSQVDARDPTGVPSRFADRDGPTTCGYSLLAIIITAIALFAFMAFAVVLGWRRLPSGMPVAGSCSAALSAACHCPEGTSELRPVMWGVIPEIKKHTEDGEPVGHCAFSNGPVEPPIEGHLYA